MSEKKRGFFSTLCKVAAVALFTPFQLNVRDDGEERSKITVRSLAASVTYTPAKGDEPADLTISVPGVEFGKCALKMGARSYTIDSEKIKAKVQHACEDAFKNLANKVGEAVKKAESAAHKAENAAKEAGDFAADEGEADEDFAADEGEAGEEGVGEKGEGAEDDIF